MRIRAFSTAFTKSLASVLEGLNIYKTTYGHCKIPKSFIVPSNDINWPKDMAEFPLGQALKDVSSVKDQTTLSENEIALLNQASSKSSFTKQSFRSKFPMFLEALELYKKMQQHTLVPCSFVVPSNDDKWPKEFVGMPLGEAVQLARRYKRNDVLLNSEIDALNRLGMVWNTVSYAFTHSFSPFVKALETYRMIYGDTFVKVNFVVPENDENWPKECAGMKLGYYIQRARTRKKQGLLTSSQVDTLNQVGMSWEARYYSRSISLVLDALKVYGEMYGNTKIASTFRIGENDINWPKNLRGMKLGCMIRQIRTAHSKGLLFDSEIESLTNAGMIWRRVFEFQDVLTALKTYKSVYGHLRVPTTTRFVIPAEAPWPPSTWRMSLVYRVKYLRKNKEKLPLEQIAALKEIGFIFNVHESDWTERIYPMLCRYKEYYGDLFVPNTFIVPNAAPWPKEMHGQALGTTVVKLRQKQVALSASVQEQLNQLGMIWHPRTHRFESRILPALQAYYAACGNLNMNCHFVVPSTKDFPKHLWRLNLGSILYAMKRKDRYYEQVKSRWSELEEMGFAFVDRVEEPFTSDEIEDLIYGLSLYEQKFGHKGVSAAFDPHNVPDWPAKHIPLGQLVKKARYLYQRDELDTQLVQRLSDHGMLWGPSAFKCTILPALRTYKEIFGHLRIPISFRIPSEPAWPPSTWGNALGHQASRIRIGRGIIRLDEHDQEALRELGLSRVKN